jgi:hypothetical protein
VLVALYQVIVPPSVTVAVKFGDASPTIRDIGVIATGVTGIAFTVTATVPAVEVHPLQ